MQIAIIGAGNVGKALASGLTKAGYTVTLSAKDPAHARDAAEAIGTRAAADNVEAVRESDLVVLAVPFSAAPDIVGQLGEALRGKVVRDATNQFSPDRSGLDRWDRSVAEQVQQRSAAPVVKAFNTAFAANMATGSVAGTPLDGFYAGDDAAAKAGVARLLGDLGFRPIDVGRLAMSRVLEGMAFVNIGLNVANGWPWQSGFNLVGPTSAAA